MEQKNNFPVCPLLNSQAAGFCLCGGGWLVISSILEVSTPGEAYGLSGYICAHGRCRAECSFCGDVVDSMLNSLLHGNKSNNTGRTSAEHNAHPCSESGRALASFEVGHLPQQVQLIFYEINPCFSYIFQSSLKSQALSSNYLLL